MFQGFERKDFGIWICDLRRNNANRNDKHDVVLRQLPAIRERASLQREIFGS